MLKVAMSSGIVFALSLTVHANVCTLPASNGGSFIVNSNGSSMGGAMNCTSVMQDHDTWSNFSGLPAGSIAHFSFTTISGHQQVDTLTILFGFDSPGASYSWSYKLAVNTGTTSPFQLVASDIVQSLGSSAVGTSIGDNNSNTYAFSYTQNGITITGPTGATFKPGTTVLNVSETLNILSTGSDVTADANSYTQATATVVPELGTLVMLGTGVIGVAGLTRRKLKWT
jgi:hypothetical protein